MVGTGALRQVTDMISRGEYSDGSGAAWIRTTQGPDTSAAAVMSSLAQNGEEASTEHRWSDHSDEGYLTPRPRYNGKREYDRGTEGGTIENLHSRLRASGRRLAPRGLLQQISMKTVVRKLSKRE